MKWINMLSQNIGNEQDLFQNESSFAVIFIRRDQKTNAFEPQMISVIIHHASWNVNKNKKKY